MDLMIGTEIVLLSATELHMQIASRNISSVEATQAYLDRIDRGEPRLNAFITVLADDALEAAGLVDSAIAAGIDEGPLYGVPVAIKDQIDGGLRILTMGGSQ